jgi:biopolymer transport protein ExbD
VPEGEEIRHLNIMPMMDMMTILLVAFIFQASVATTGFDTNTVKLPKAMATEPLPENAVTLIITPTVITIDGEPVVPVRNGDVDPSKREGGIQGVKIPSLTTFLSNYRAEVEAKMREKNQEVPAVPEMMIIADRNTRYWLLVSVMFSAKQKEAGYKRFRLITLKHKPVGPS